MAMRNGAAACAITAVAVERGTLATTTLCAADTSAVFL